MRFVGKILITTMLMIFSLTFFACDMPTSPELSCSGIVTINNIGFNDVVIKSSIKEYATTTPNGAFSFNTKAKTITIYPEKSGYIFSPKQITLKAGQNTANFTAQKIENLQGKLKLNSLIITPTSILSSPENYSFLHNGKQCLKASEITVKYNNLIKQLNLGDVYLSKLEKNVLYNSSNVTFNCGENVSIGLLINTYFNSYYQTFKTTETEFTYLYINKQQTNEMLQDGQVTYNLYGINNKTKCFTFDVAFVFDYIPNI